MRTSAQGHQVLLVVLGCYADGYLWMGRISVYNDPSDRPGTIGYGWILIEGSILSISAYATGTTQHATATRV